MSELPLGKKPFPGYKWTYLFRLPRLERVSIKTTEDALLIREWVLHMKVSMVLLIEKMTGDTQRKLKIFPETSNGKIKSNKEDRFLQKHEKGKEQHFFQQNIHI